MKKTILSLATLLFSMSMMAQTQVKTAEGILIGKKNIKDLRALPAEELLKLAAVKAIPTYNIDGYFLTEQPTETFAKGNQTKVPLLIGGNNQEMSPWAVLAGKQPTVENLKAGAKAMFGDNVDEAFRLYGINSDKDVLEQPEDYMVSDIFSQYYANFVKTGNPNGLGLVEWPTTNGIAVAPVLQIDVNTTVKADEPMEKRYDFIDIFLQQNRSSQKLGQRGNSPCPTKNSYLAREEFIPN